VKRILELESHVAALQARLGEVLADLEAMHGEIARRERAVHQSYRRDLVPIEPQAVVVWQPKPRKP
jgi:MerR family transcriptional regulator/heat shock protein HspR